MIRLLPPPKSDEDLFRESTMTFGEHLEELRQCLFRALFGLAIGIVIGLLFGNWVVKLIQTPLEKALTKHYVRLSEREVKRQIEQLNQTGAAVPFTAEAASQFVVSRQVLAEEYLVSPRELVVQFASALQAVETRWQADLEAVRFFQSYLKTSPAPPSDGDKRDLLERAWAVLESRSVAAPVEGAKGASEEGQLIKVGFTEISKHHEAWREGQALSAEAQTQLLKLATDVATEIEQGLLAINNSQTQLSGLFRAALHEPGRVAESEFMHVFLWRPARDDPRVRAKSLSAHEAFAIYMKASFLFGAILSSPWVFYQIWSFVAAGLYRHERRFVYIFLPFSLGLFLAGAALAFVYVFEPVLTFLFQFNDWLGIQLEPRISDWLSFVLILPLGFGIGFQLPLVMLFLERIGIFTVKDYVSQWRIAVVVIFVIAAFLTPPDPSSMLLMALPLSLLYFGGILLCKFFPRQMTARPAI